MLRREVYEARVHSLLRSVMTQPGIDSFGSRQILTVRPSEQGNEPSGSTAKPELLSASL
jgi:hypothetical protein